MSIFGSRVYQNIFDMPILMYPKCGEKKIRKFLLQTENSHTIFFIHKRNEKNNLEKYMRSNLFVRYIYPLNDYL